MENIVVKIDNFNLNIFKNLLNQNIGNEIIIEFSKDMIKSCSFSNTKSFIKLWLIPFKNIITKQKDELGDEIESDDIEFDFPTFDFFVVNGDALKKHLSVYESESINLELTLSKIDNKYQAVMLGISGKSTGGFDQTTNFEPSTSDVISNSVNDYNTIITECKPTENTSEFILTNSQIQIIKSNIKKLHNSIANNKTFLTFEYSSEDNILSIYDSVFNLKFEITEENKIVEDIKFDVLKSDFIKTGNHTFTIYTDNNSEKVIFGTNYSGAMIWGLATKTEGIDSVGSIDDTLDDFELISSLDIGEYL